MTIFVVIRVQNPDSMRKAITSKFPLDHFDLGNNEWLVSGKGTAKGISDKLGVTSDPNSAGTAIVFSMDGYFGRAPSNIWDWIKTKAEATNG
jgi:hypothetical protein